ncbi:uncharacterized protein LOC121792855 [Salvia splendens]|uniref:uncharacterized protein LOC121792855 n=1 Tax=Salvia splendens TaxID=180675 RepID=UPI001C275850|nr:uncharacterized protein LOC121792855 [Salvia splendens]
MASATVDSGAAASTTDGGLLRLDSIPIVDLRLLSQSELYSLSRCSSSAADPNRRDDVVIPIIDRSVFNESAGSRKQTYSRLRLAPTDSPSAATPRSRTPHLRSPAAAYGSINTKTDPENVENHQIINLLKQFFVADMDPADLFPVKIEYLNSLPPQQFSSPPSPPPVNFPSIGVKRKRGRPRKAVEVSVIDGSYADTLQLPMPSLSEFIPRDNADEKDREVLNSDGVAVDLAALGASEHPYREEIRRRTDGMRTEEELLGFLTGLYGRWGSRRKKKRIVDANEFGSKLPVGWKLSLSVKKKNGNVWLYCRRYISPSGLHFVTCKGVSSYLLSLHGMQDTNPCTFVQYNDIVNDADKLTTVPLVVEDDYEIETFSHAPSPPLDLVTANPEILVTVNVGNASEDRIGESLCCHKCNITFKDKDEFLNHQSSLHRKNKNIVRITDGVIIKDGKYECQFCHKTFSERHRYNGHVGTHVRFQPKLVGEFSQSVYPTSVNVYPTQDNAVEGSSKSHNAMDVCNTITNNGPTICSNHDKIHGHFGELEDGSRNIRGMDKATDTVTETNHSSVPEVLFTSNENKSSHNDACLNDSAAEISKDGSMMQGVMMMESTLSQNGAADKDMTVSVIENSVSTDNPMQSMASKCLLDSNDHMEECPVVNDNQHRRNDSNQKTMELNFDPQSLGLNESVLSLFGTQGQGLQDKNLAVSKTDLEILPCKDIATTESITSGPEASKLEKGPNISMPIADNGKASKEDNIPCSAVTCKVGDTLSFSKYENDSSKANNEGVNMHEELQYGMDSNIQTWNRQEDATNKDFSEVFTHLLDVPGVHGMSKSHLAANDKNTYHYENNDGGVCGRETKMPEFDCLQNFGSGQSSDLFSSSSAIVSSNSITGANQDTRLGVCSPFISTTDKQLSAEDNMITMFNDTMKEHRQDPSEGILLNQSGISEVSNGAFTSDKVYSTANPSELNGIEIAGKHELSLSFGSLQTDMCAESNRVEQESYRGNSFNIEAAGPKTYGNPTHSSILSSNIAADMEQARPFGYSNISFNDTTNEPGNSFNVVQGGRDWDGTRGNEVRTSSQNFMVGFGNGSLQTSECAAADGSWRNGPDNVFGGCYDANSTPHIQSSSFFPTFGLAPTTGQESSFGVDHNYGIQSDMMRPVRAQPVEYSFMSEQRVNSLPGEAKNFPYGTNMEQEMDPSFWLGKDALMPNASHISQATSICVWCRNVFLNEHVEAGVQTGAIGTICPSCSSRIPGHFNVL